MKTNIFSKILSFFSHWKDNIKSKREVFLENFIIGIIGFIIGWSLGNVLKNLF